MRPDEKAELTRLDRLYKLRARAWERFWDMTNTFRAHDWWSKWWYRLDDEVQHERWRDIPCRERSSK